MLGLFPADSQALLLGPLPYLPTVSFQIGHSQLVSSFHMETWSLGMGFMGAVCLDPSAWIKDPLPLQLEVVYRREPMDYALPQQDRWRLVTAWCGQSNQREKSSNAEPLWTVLLQRSLRGCAKALWHTPSSFWVFLSILSHPQQKLVVRALL